MVSYQMYETLYQYHYLKMPYTIVPLLAAELPKISKDGKTYQIRIKPDVKYHASEYLEPGRTVKSQDFINSFKRLAYQGTNSKGWSLYSNQIQGLDEFRSKVNNLNLFFKTPINGLKKINDLEFSITFKKSISKSHALNLLSLIFTTPIPEEIIRAKNNQIETFAVGTGPFILKEFDLYKGVHFTKNTDYKVATYPISGDRMANLNNMLKDSAQKLPFVDFLHLKVVKNADNRWAQFLDGDISMSDIPGPKVQEVIGLDGRLKPQFRKKFNLFSSPSLTLWWLAFNMNDPIIGQNQKLRHAMSMAIDIDSFMQIFTGNSDQKANSIFPPGILGHHPSNDLGYRYDLSKAKKIMQELGHSKSKRLKITFHTRREDKKDLAMADFYKEQLAKIYIDLEIKVNTFKEFLRKAKKGNMQMWQGGWLLDYPDPENILQLLYSGHRFGGTNKTGFSNKNFDLLYESLPSLDRDSKELLNTVHKMEQIVLSHRPWIMMYYSKNFIVYQNTIQNLRFSELIMNFPKYLALRPAQ
jgi:ABC-type transport system substrate-binding protein